MKSDKSVMVVSPDGSCRTNGMAVVGIEIKCPKPGKKFTPDVHYKISEYYVPHILSEMKALECSTLFYMCWTPESCTILRANFQEELWSALATETDNILPHEGVPVKPKRKSDNVPFLKQMIRLYVSFPDKRQLLSFFSSQKCRGSARMSRKYQTHEQLYERYVH